MRKMFRNNKGFSLVELLIALLIMAVISAVAISLFGSVLSNSKDKADTETANAIKRGILTYMNESNDMSLTHILHGTASELISKLKVTTTIENAADGTNNGTYGPYIDPNMQSNPQGKNKTAWSIDITASTLSVTVTAASADHINVN